MFDLETKKAKKKKSKLNMKHKCCMIYPENKIKDNWDIVMAVVLIVSCMISPVRIAFPDKGEEPIGWTIYNYTVDSLFFLDIVVTFNTALLDDDFRVIDNRKVISKKYLSGWFMVDTLAIVPFDKMFT
jgi:hypothetical protein